jgi:hypothetical protein
VIVFGDQIPNYLSTTSNIFLSVDLQYTSLRTSALECLLRGEKEKQVSLCKDEESVGAREHPSAADSEELVWRSENCPTPCREHFRRGNLDGRGDPRHEPHGNVFLFLAMLKYIYFFTDREVY